MLELSVWFGAAAASEMSDAFCECPALPVADGTCLPLAWQVQVFEPRVIDDIFTHILSPPGERGESAALI